MPKELKDATVHSLLNESQQDWDDELLRDICNNRDRRLIMQIPVSLQQMEGSWFWLLEDKGQFIVRSCYRKLHGEHDCLDKGFWKKLWSLNLPSKVINFLWRTCRDVLPTGAALVVKRVNIVSTCPWCHQGIEDAMYVLFRCSFAQEVWKVMGLQTMITDLQNDTVMNLFKKNFHTGTADQCVMVGLCCWCLWARRNKWVWLRANQSVFGIKSKAFSMLSEWKKSRDTSNARCAQTQVELGVLCGMMRVVLRARSNVLRGGVQPREAEALSLKEALSWTKDCRSTRCVFEFDAKLLVDAVNGNRGISYFDTIAADCSEILKHFDEVLVVYVNRSVNIVAHLLARATNSTSGLKEWLYTAPDFIACTLDLEAN